MESKINYNKKRRSSTSKEDQEKIYVELSNELDKFIDDNSIFHYTKSGKRILIDKGEKIKNIKIRIRAEYVEVSNRFCVNYISYEESLGRFILGIKDKDIFVDHINRNPLDNRKSNLRTCNRSQNLFNRRKRVDSICKYKGLSIRGNGIVVTCIKDHITHSVFLNSKDQALAGTIYDCLSIQLHGEFSNPNFPRERYTDDFIFQTLNDLKINVKARTR